MFTNRLSLCEDSYDWLCPQHSDEIRSFLQTHIADILIDEVCKVITKRLNAVHNMPKDKVADVVRKHHEDHVAHAMLSDDFHNFWVDFTDRIPFLSDLQKTVKRWTDQVTKVTEALFETPFQEAQSKLRQIVKEASKCGVGTALAVLKNCDTDSFVCKDIRVFVLACTVAEIICV